jgi:hypothetical protein
MSSRQDYIIRRDEENDELMLFLLPTLHLLGTSNERENQDTYLAGSNLFKKLLMDMRRIIV